MKQFQENVWAEGRMERQMDRQTLFHRDEMLNVGGTGLASQKISQPRLTAAYVAYPVI